MEFTRVLINKNQHLIDGEVSQLKFSKDYFQNYIDKVDLLGVDLQANDLVLLFQNPKEYITDKLTQNETLKVGNLTLNKEKLFDLIEKPTGTNELIESIISDKQNQNTNRLCIFLVNNFVINNKEVVVKQTVLDAITERHSLFIETENQQTGYNKMLQVVQLINEINELAKTKIGLDTELNEILTYNDPDPNDKTTYQKSYKVIARTVKRFI